MINYISRVIDKIALNHLSRSVTLGPKTKWLLGLTDEQINNFTSQHISEEDALKISVVFGCIRVISETISSLPLKWYELKSDDSKIEIRNYPLGEVFKNPNKFQTQMDFISTVCNHIELRGNAYVGINYNRGRNKIIELIPLLPGNMQCKLVNNSLVYNYTDPETGENKDYTENDIWHIRGMSKDGVIGISTLSYARTTFDLAIQAEKHGITYYKNGARTSGFIKHPRNLKEPTRISLQRDINHAISGNNKFKVIVLEEGMDWASVSMTNEDSQYLQSRGFQVEEICRFFNINPTLIQHPTKMMSYASAEQFFLSFVKNSIRPRLVRLEQRINELIPEPDRDRISAEFKVDGLLRGDTKSRYESYAIAIANRILNPNEARRFENLNPYPGGDKYENPNINVNDDSNNNDGKNNKGDDNNADA